jgi:competence protein ComEC
MLMAGQALAAWQAKEWAALRLPDPGAGSRALVEGIIEGVPEREGLALRFHLRAADREARLWRIQWRDAHAAPRAGERWRLLLRLAPLEEVRNFSGLDAARLAFRDGVHGGGRVLPSALNELVRLAPASVHTARARIAARVREDIANPDAAALVTALAVGLTAQVSRDQWRVFNATGTTHLVAISGLHVTLFAWLAIRLARLLWRWLPGLHHVEREPFALLLGLAAAGGYALLAGFSVPTQRTWLMLALYVASRLVARHVGAGRLWAMALILVLLTDARAPLAAGFWLSFVAVAVLLGFAAAVRGETAPMRLWRALRTQLAIMVALAPAGFAIFDSISLVGLAVNLVAIPVVSLVLVPLVLAGALMAWFAPGVDAPFFSMSESLYDWLWPALAWCADLGAATWRVTPSAWWYFVALPASLVWLCRWPLALRLTALCALLPLMFAPRPQAPGTLRATVLDAGRGSAVLLRTRGHALLFDTGDAWNTRGTRLMQVVLPELDHAGIRRVDLLVLPSLDQDRARAAALLALERGLKRAIVSGGWPGSGLRVSRCRDSRWRWDGVEFSLYSQGRHCVLRVSAGAVLLLAGDLDAGAERALLARLPSGALASDIVLMSRQAGSSASSRQWIESTAPGLAIATGGVKAAKARAQVLERWRLNGSRILDSRQQGAIELHVDARGYEARVISSTRYPFHWRR